MQITSQNSWDRIVLSTVFDSIAIAAKYWMCHHRFASRWRSTAYTCVWSVARGWWWWRQMTPCPSPPPTWSPGCRHQSKSIVFSENYIELEFGWIFPKASSNDDNEFQLHDPLHQQGGGDWPVPGVGSLAHLHSGAHGQKPRVLWIKFILFLVFREILSRQTWISMFGTSTKQRIMNFLVNMRRLFWKAPKYTLPLQECALWIFSL